MAGWYPAEYYIQPKYESYPDLLLVDVAAIRLRPKRAKFWRRARDKALEGWADCGAMFHVTESVRGYDCGEVTLALYDTDDATAGQAATLSPPPDESCVEGAWARIDIEWFAQQYRSNITVPLQTVIGHELGHVLGFGHAPPQGHLMDTIQDARVPSAEECAALRAYWEGP